MLTGFWQARIILPDIQQENPLFFFLPFLVKFHPAMKALAMASCLFFWLLQAMPDTLFAKTPFDRGSVQGIFEEEETFMDSRFQPLEEDYDRTGTRRHHPPTT